MKIKSFETVNGDDPEAVILATQKAMIKFIRTVFTDLKKDMTTPGLTWDQIEFLITEFENKKPVVYKQDYKM